MIDPHKSIDRTSSTANQVERPRFDPNLDEKKPEFNEFPAAIIAADVAEALRPPELQMDIQGRLGTPQFESQAIASMDILKSSPSEDTLNSLSALVVQNGPDIEKSGTQQAREGLEFLNEFLVQNAQILAMKKGMRG